jgi:hypothetical protein
MQEERQLDARLEDFDPDVQLGIWTPHSSPLLSPPDPLRLSLHLETGKALCASSSQPPLVLFGTRTRSVSFLNNRDHLFPLVSNRHLLSTRR